MNTEECVRYYKDLIDSGMSPTAAADLMMTDMGVLPEDMFLIVEESKTHD